MGLATVAAKIAGGAAKAARTGAKAAKRGYKRGLVRGRRFLRKHGDDILETGFSLLAASMGAKYKPTWQRNKEEKLREEAEGGRGDSGSGTVELPQLGTPKKAEKIASPTVATIGDQLKDILKVSGVIKDITAGHHKLLAEENRQAVRLSREETQERVEKQTGIVDATPEPTGGTDIGAPSTLEDDFNDLHDAIQSVIDKLNGITGGDGGGDGPDIDVPDVGKSKGKGRFGRALRGMGRFLRGGANLARSGGMAVLEGAANLTGTTAGVAAAGIAGAAAATAGLVYGTDQYMKATYSEADKPLKELERRYGMKAVKNSSGFTTHFEIKGKKYKSDSLPPDYQTLLDAYGPGADPRMGTTRKALEYIKKNPEHFKALEVETQRRRIQAGIQGPKPGTPGAQAAAPMAQATAPQAVSASPPPSATPSSGGTNVPSGGGGGGGGGAPPARDAGADTSKTDTARSVPAAVAVQESPAPTAGEAIEKFVLPDVYDGDINTFPINTLQGIQRVRTQEVRTGFTGTGNVPDPTYYDIGNIPSSILFYTPFVKPDGTHPTLAESRY